jgi:hypothetical protein
MWKMAECYEADNKPAEAISETKRALGLISCMYSEKKIVNFQNYVDFFEMQIERIQKESDTYPHNNRKKSCII